MATFQGFGKIFDFALQASEGRIPTIQHTLKNSHLFCFPHDPEEVLGKTNLDSGQVEFWKENFACIFSYFYDDSDFIYWFV